MADKWANIQILLFFIRAIFTKFPKQKNISAKDTLWKYTTFEIGLSGFKGQGQTKVKKLNIS